MPRRWKLPRWLDLNLCWKKSVWNINPVNCEVDRSQAGMVCVCFNRGIQPVKYEFTEI